MLVIRDGGGSDATLAEESADVAGYPTLLGKAPPPVMAGTNTNQVRISVDFALGPK